VELNAIAPYFTMFPIDYPLRAIERLSKPGDLVLDPFCGRGTTNLAARVLRRRTYGIDCNPVAVAVARAKMVAPEPAAIVETANSILNEPTDEERPYGEFWSSAYEPSVLARIVKLRSALNKSCTSSERIALKAIVLGALHGPRNKTEPSYFSNQCPRTYAPKPAYSARYWRDRRLSPPKVDVVRIIQQRADRYYGMKRDKVPYSIVEGDARHKASYSRLVKEGLADLIVTSPPYPGMTTYYTDQWLRNWFLGGPDYVDYSRNDGIRSLDKGEFISGLRDAWSRIAEFSTDDARLVCRFGVLPCYRGEKLEIIRDTFRDTAWNILRIESAGIPRKGKRIADTFAKNDASVPNEELDILCVKGLK
jgi:hypothetical protein